MKKVNKLGFTLIELLVVITIIGILATGAINVFTTQLQWARDSTRISDMKVTETAIQQYYVDNDIYPKVTNSWAFLDAIKQYVSKDIKDPKKWRSICINGASSRNWLCAWYYRVGQDSYLLENNAYKLSVRFEKDWNKWRMTNDGDNTWTWTYLFDLYGWWTGWLLNTPTLKIY